MARVFYAQIRKEYYDALVEEVKFEEESIVAHLQELELRQCG